MSDVEYYLLEKDGDNSKCGVLDLGKCIDSDENSAGEAAFPKEANNPSARGKSLEENNSKPNTTNVMEHNQESKSSDDQLLSFLSSQEGSPDVNPNRDVQCESDVNDCKSPENMLKDLIGMNVGSGPDLPGNGVNPQGKNESTIPEQMTDVSHSHSTKSQDEAADSNANSKSLTEILDDFCSAPSEIIAPNEMSFSALVENDDTDKKTSQNNQVQSQDIEMAEIWGGDNTEKIVENGTMSQGREVECLKESNKADDKEEEMETEEDAGNKIKNVKDQPDQSENSAESAEKERDAVEAKLDDKDNEEEMETTEHEVVAKNMEEEDISGQKEGGESVTDLGSSSKDAPEGELASTAMETEEEESSDVKAEEKGVATLDEGNVGKFNSDDSEGNQGTKDELQEHRKENDEKEKELGDEETGTQENSANLMEKETSDIRNSQEKSESLTDQDINFGNEKEKIHDEPEDVLDEEVKNSQKEKLKADEDGAEHQSSKPVSLEGKENFNTINDKDSTLEAKEKSPEKLDADNSKDLNTNEDKGVEIQVTSVNPDAVCESPSKTEGNEKSPIKETTISETEKEIFESPKPKSVGGVVETRLKAPPKSVEVVTPKGKSKADNGKHLVVSMGKQSNTDDGFVDYDEESIENITKTIKSFTSESPTEKKQQAKRNDASKKVDSSPSKQVIVVKTSSNVERVKRKLEEILEKSKGEEDAAIAELQRMKKEKTDILNAITTEMEKLKAILVKGKQG